MNGACSAQVGVLNDALTNVDNVVRKGRLGPGQTVCADLSCGEFKEHQQIAREIATSAPFGEWLAGSARLKDLGATGYAQEPAMSAARVRPLTPPLCESCWLV